MISAEWVGALVASATLALTIAGAVVALVQYRKSQNWKRAEFLSQLMKEFKQDANVKSALKLLDWNLCQYYIDPHKITVIQAESDKVFGLDTHTIDDTLIESALHYHIDAQGRIVNWDGKQEFVRESFDGLFDQLEALAAHVENKLISKEQLKPYVGYCLDILGGLVADKKQEPLRKRIWVYMDNYRYTYLLKMLAAYGYVNPNA